VLDAVTHEGMVVSVFAIATAGIDDALVVEGIVVRVTL